MDSDILLTQVYRVGGDDARATMRVGVVRSVNVIKGLIDVEVAGELLRDVPYAAGLSPIVGASVWLIEQGSWFAAVSASANSGQAAGGPDEVIVGGAPPTQVSVDLWVDTSAEGDGDGWEVLDRRYVPIDGGAMTGPLLLSGDPVDPLQAVTKQYLDLNGGGGQEVYVGGERPDGLTKPAVWIDTDGLAPMAVFQEAVALGMVVSFAGDPASIPTGWHLCDGSAHGSPELAALIGSPNAPDLRDRFILGTGTRDRGATGGAETHTLSVAEMPAHNHDGRMPIWDEGVVNAEPGWKMSEANNWHARPRNISAQGGGAAHNNMPPFYALAFIICTDPVAAGAPARVLDALADVEAPASTPAGMLLGTTAQGQWGPVAQSQRTTLIPAPGWTDIGGDNGGMFVTRVGDVVTIDAMLKPVADTPLGGASWVIATIPEGFRPARSGLYSGLLRASHVSGNRSARFQVWNENVVIGPFLAEHGATMLAAESFVSIAVSYRAQ